MEAPENAVRRYDDVVQRLRLPILDRRSDLGLRCILFPGLQILETEHPRLNAFIP